MYRVRHTLQSDENAKPQKSLDYSRACDQYLQCLQMMFEWCFANRQCSQTEAKCFPQSYWKTSKWKQSHHFVNLGLNSCHTSVMQFSTQSILQCFTIIKKKPNNNQWLDFDAEEQISKFLKFEWKRIRWAAEWMQNCSALRIMLSWHDLWKKGR